MIKNKIILWLAILIVLFLTALFFVFKINWGTNNFGYSKPAATTYNPPTTTLFFAGDIMLSRNVEAKMEAANDFSLPFQNVFAETSKNDIAFANLESPFSSSGPYYVDKSLKFDANPQAVSGLTKAGFNVLSTANNHALDNGAEGVAYTLNLLNKNNIIPIGTGTDCHSGRIIFKNGIKFGFLAYTYGTNTGPAGKDICYGTNLKQLAENIKSLRPKVDYLIISSHMGIEYQRLPTTFQKDFAHTAVDSGADLVIGNHPHWVEPVEQYKNGWIFYAMGNFVFDQMWSEETKEGLTATMTFTNENNKLSLQKIELKPVIIENFCCPRWADETETKKILEKIGLTRPVLFSTIR